MIRMPTESEPVTLARGDADCELSDVLPESADLIEADPPFGARRPSAWRSAGDRFAEVAGNDAVRSYWLSLAFAALRDGGAAYVFTCWDRMPEWREAMTAAGFRVRSCIVWDKGIHGLADLETCWAPQHEFILFGAKGRHELRGKRPKDILRAQRVDAMELLHPYQKPTSAVLPLIQASSEPGDVVLDPFMGSGTTGVACIQTGRRFIGIELDPTHYATAQRRINDALGVGGLFESQPAAADLFAGVA